MSTRYLYLARHGDAPGEDTLSPTGRRQAALLGARLAGVPLSSITHSPLTRAVETTAALCSAAATAAGSPRNGPADAGGAEPGSAGPGSGAWSGVVPEMADMVGDYVPFVPDPIPEAFAAFFEGTSSAELEEGAKPASPAPRRWRRTSW